MGLELGWLLLKVSQLQEVSVVSFWRQRLRETLSLEFVLSLLKLRGVLLDFLLKDFDVVDLGF